MALTHRDLTEWRADSWDELRRIWRVLVDGLESEFPVLMFLGEEVSPQQAGYVFQTWVVEAFRLSGADVEGPYSVRSLDNATAIEELDGLVFDDWTGFLIESKFTPGNRIDFGPIARLRLLVERRPAETMACLFAPFGFTSAAIVSTGDLRPVRVLLFDRYDLESALIWGDLMKVLRLKWRMAVKYGDPHKTVSTRDFDGEA